MARTRPAVVAGVEDRGLTGYTVVVTGATDGIGRQTAESLARMGATVVVHGRSPRKADRVVVAIEDQGGDADHYLADFQDESAVHDLADRILEDHDTVDVLVNNAGAHFRKGRLTEAGIERTFAVNHLAPFVLTLRLAPTIEAVGGRIVTVSSRVHRRADFDLETVDSVGNYDGLDAYGRSKFANVLFTYALARRLDEATTNCLHPGFVPGSALWREGNILIRGMMSLLGTLPESAQNVIGKSPAMAAATPVYLAASTGVADVSGEYFIDMEPERSAPRTYDEDLQEALWAKSLDLTSVEEPAWP